MGRRSFASPDSLWEHLERLAARNDTTVSALIRAALYDKYDPDHRVEAQEGFDEAVYLIRRGLLVALCLVLMVATLGLVGLLLVSP